MQQQRQVVSKLYSQPQVREVSKDIFFVTSLTDIVDYPVKYSSFRWDLINYAELENTHFCLGSRAPPWRGGSPKVYRERQVYAWTARISELQVILGMFSPVEHPQAATPFCRGLSACGRTKGSGMSGTRNIPLRTDPCPRMNDGSIVAGSRRGVGSAGRTAT